MYVNARKYNGLIRSALAKATEGDHKTIDPTKHYLVRDVTRFAFRKQSVLRRLICVARLQQFNIDL